jgi:hypothetical protein
MVHSVNYLISDKEQLYDRQFYKYSNPVNKDELNRTSYDGVGTFDVNGHHKTKESQGDCRMYQVSGDSTDASRNAVVLGTPNLGRPNDSFFIGINSHVEKIKQNTGKQEILEETGFLLKDQLVDGNIIHLVKNSE